jgi:hypothetical protein
VGRLIGIIAILVVVGLAVKRWTPLSALLHTTSESSSEVCRIKENIRPKGERIYHVPGGDWYDKTRIDTMQGERWFCSEEEARAAGWRRSYE